MKVRLFHGDLTEKIRYANFHFFAEKCKHLSAAVVPPNTDSHPLSAGPANGIRITDEGDKVKSPSQGWAFYFGDPDVPNVEHNMEIVKRNEPQTFKV